MFPLHFFFQIDECENLPKSICDSCIVQLNVAYSFKKNAIQSDIKLRQYLIEYGVGIFPYNGMNNSNFPFLRTSNTIMPANGNGSQLSIDKPRPLTNNGISNSNGSSSNNNNNSNVLRPFPVMPLIIKEEPIDYEIMSDITIETNVEAYDEFNNDQRVHNANAGSRNIINQRQEKSITPSSSHSMVTLNDKSLLISASNTDGDYISAYLPTPSSTINHSPVESTASVSSISQSKRSGSTSSKSTNRSHGTANKGPAKTEKSSTSNSVPTVDSLKTDSEFKINLKAKKRRSAKGPLDRLTINMKAPSPVFNKDSNLRTLRTHDGSLKKKDYHSFFGARRAINPLSPQGRNKVFRQIKSGAKRYNELFHEKPEQLPLVRVKSPTDNKMKTNKSSPKPMVQQQKVSAIRRDRRLSVYRPAL